MRELFITAGRVLARPALPDGVSLTLCIITEAVLAVLVLGLPDLAVIIDVYFPQQRNLL